jgi:hypothetical protein
MTTPDMHGTLYRNKIDFHFASRGGAKLDRSAMGTKP